jgi:hypothetical protein
MISKVGAVIPGLALTPAETTGVTAAISIGAMLAMFRAAAVLQQHNADREVAKLHRAYASKREDDVARAAQLLHARQMTEDQMRAFLMNRGVYPGADPFSAPYVAEAMRRNAEK